MIQQRLRFLALALVSSLSLLCLPLFAQDAPEALRPPKGATLAIVVFEDLQCPQCGRVAPLLAQASRTYKIPLVQHDFPLPMHNWSFDAAVMARYFDTHSKELGNEFRETVFAHQMEISPQNLRAFEEKFAAEQRRALVAMVEAGPIPAIHEVVRWRLCDLAQWLLAEFGLSVSKQILSRELRALGYRKQQTHRQALRRSHRHQPALRDD